MSIFGDTPQPDQKPTRKPERPQDASAGKAERSRSEPGAATPPGLQGRSVLGAGCRLEGEIGGSGSLECRGKIEGTVSLDGDMLIGEGGSVKARVAARRITVSGRLEGDAVGREKVEVGSTGEMQGDIRAPSVSFAEGAFFEGNVEMGATGGERAEAPDTPGTADEEDEDDGR